MQIRVALVTLIFYVIGNCDAIVPLSKKRFAGTHSTPSLMEGEAGM